MSSSEKYRQVWTEEEVHQTVTFYLDMLKSELNGKPVNKAEKNRQLQEIIQRNRGAIELKHQNISAVFINLGYPYIDGYKPMRNLDKIPRFFDLPGAVTHHCDLKATQFLGYLR